MAIRVKAIRKGLYGGRVRNPGEVFEISNSQAFSGRWMEKVSNAKRADSKPAARKKAAMKPIAKKSAAKATGPKEG